MTYGHFDDDSREYVITDPRTPVKWINYVGTLDFGGIVDHTGGALICKGDPALNRITRYVSQLPAGDFRGTTLYVRKTNGTGRHAFSPFFVPMLLRLDSYECRIGLGYTRIVSRFRGVQTDTTLFVPLHGQAMLSDIQVTNVSESSMRLELFPVVEYSHPDALKQFTNADWVPQTMQSRAVREEDGRVILLQYPFMFRDARVNFFSANLPVTSFETDRRRFLGENEYRTWASPLSLEMDRLSDSEAVRGDNMAALHIDLGVIAPKDSRRCVALLGQDADLAAARQIAESYRDPAAVDRAFRELQTFWRSYLANVQVSTPDVDLDRIVNVHNPRQCHVTKNWSRYLSLYQLGYGARGIGSRDSSQDILGVLDRMPEEAAELMVKLLSVQKRNGSAMHQFNPLTMVATEGDSLEREDRPHYYSDDHLWIVLAVCWYVKETGDRAFLDRLVPFYEKDKSEHPLESEPVLEHLRRALRFTAGDLGRHGLPLLGFADWNDTVNLASGAESVFTACLYGVALREMAELCDAIGDTSAAQIYRADHQSMRATVERTSWDGEWYVRYFDHDGSPLGSASNDKGRIYINAQSWSVISGFASPDRGRAALDSVNRLLNTPHGIKVSRPGFNGFDPARGGVTTYPPGAKENGGIFLHTNPWVMIAEALLGNGDRAYEYYRQINPAAHNESIETYECEPYVYAQNILGDEHPLFGLARNSWLSGTAAWSYTAATKYILGVRPSHRGLCIDPCIPHQWNGFTVSRQFRGARYDIAVRNPNHISKGRVVIEVDGRSISGNTVTPAAPGTVVKIQATMFPEHP